MFLYVLSNTLVIIVIESIFADQISSACNVVYNNKL